jgi:hypothetical protein
MIWHLSPGMGPHGAALAHGAWGWNDWASDMGLGLAHDAAHGAALWGMGTMGINP